MDDIYGVFTYRRPGFFRRSPGDDSVVFHLPVKFLGTSFGKLCTEDTVWGIELPDCIPYQNAMLDISWYGSKLSNAQFFLIKTSGEPHGLTPVPFVVSKLSIAAGFLRDAMQAECPR